MQQIAVTIVNGAASVAEVEIEAAIRANRKSVNRMVVLRPAGLGEKYLLAVGDQVTVIVMKNKNLRRAGDNYPPARAVTDHADAEG